MDRLKRKVRIVPMTRDYVDEVTELENLCFTTPWSRKLLDDEMDNDASAYLLALDEETEKVVGFAGLFVIADEGYVTNVAVHPDYRRIGIASSLLEVFLRFAEGNDLALLTLEVRASNYGAIALYGHYGFRSMGRKPNYYADPKEDAIIMTKKFRDKDPSE